MLVPPVVEGEGEGHPTEPQPLSSTALPKQILVAVGDEAVYTGEDDRVVRAATTAASLEAEQESGNINTRSTTTLNELSPQGTGLGSGPRLHVTTLGDTYAQTRVLVLEQFKTAQDLVIKRLRKKVKRLEKKKRERTTGMNPFKIGSGETKVFNYTTAAEKDVNAAEPVSTTGDAVNAASVIPDVSAAGPSTSTSEDIFEDEMTTITDTLMAIRSTRPRTTLVVIHNVEEEPRRATSPLTVLSQEKGKAAKQEAKDAALIEQMEDVQARMDADVLLAERLQQEEREQFTINEQARMLVDLIAERKSKKRSRANHDKESVKKQKLEEDDAEKEELRACLDIVLQTLKAARDLQKSYANNRRMPLEFSVGDEVPLKVSPMKGVKFLADVDLNVSLKEVKIDDKLHFVKEPMEIMDREAKKLKKRRIPIVKVHWSSQRGPKFTWEGEYEMKRNYL
nr:hypothetical protein [Tanacetum cinerariifolium]